MQGGAEASGPRGLPEAIAGLPVHVGLGKDDQVGLMHLGLAHDPVPLGLIAGVPSFSFKAVGVASPNIQIAGKVPGLPPQGARVTGFPDSNGAMRPTMARCSSNLKIIGRRPGPRPGGRLSMR